MPIGGMFCGQSWGPAVFYSETRSLVLTVKLFKLLREQSGYNFDFRIEYKFLSREESVVRYGGLKSDIFENMTKETHHSSNEFDNKLTAVNMKSKVFGNYQEDFSARANNWYENVLNLTSSTAVAGGKSQKKSKPKATKNITVDAKYYLGDLIPGTYCSRIYSNCDKKHCRLQSPNFPGTYPRNLTCYYAVRQVSLLEKLFYLRLLLRDFLARFFSFNSFTCKFALLKNQSLENIFKNEFLKPDIKVSVPFSRRSNENERSFYSFVKFLSTLRTFFDAMRTTWKQNAELRILTSTYLKMKQNNGK